MFPGLAGALIGPVILLSQLIEFARWRHCIFGGGLRCPIAVCDIYTVAYTSMSATFLVPTTSDTGIMYCVSPALAEWRHC